MALPAPHWIATLAADGHCTIPALVDEGTINALNLDLDPHFAAQPVSRGAFYGERTKRFGALLRRSNSAEKLVRHPLVLKIVEAILGPWCDRIALNLTQAIEIGAGAPAQFPHRDQDMWGGTKGEQEYLVNVMWPLVPFTQANGATLLWPGSHRSQSDAATSGKPIAAEMIPGSALLFLGSTLHGGGGNVTTAPRRGIVVSYCLGWLKPFELQWLVYPPAVARTFDPELAALVGYAQHRPNLGNVEGQCPSVLLSDRASGPGPATDALTPAQEAMLGNWIAAGGGRR